MDRPVTTTRGGRSSSARNVKRAPRPPARARPKVPPPSGPRFGPAQSTAPVRFAAVLPFVVAVALIAVAASGVLEASVSVALGLVGIVAAAVGIANRAIGSTRRILSSFDGRQSDQSSDARLINLVDGLCFAFGLPLPSLLVVDADAPNAIALGRTPQTTTLVITTGALALLDRIELEGLLAHELAHVRRGDTARAAAVMAGIALAASLSEWGARLGMRLGGPEREGLADLAAITVTRYPPALADALETIGEAVSVVPKGLAQEIVRLTSWQWCAPLKPTDPEDRRVGELDLTERIAALREL